jgi:uncharacterized protein with ATP-grasp and redox domains
MKLPYPAADKAKSVNLPKALQIAFSYENRRMAEELRYAVNVFILFDNLIFFDKILLLHG